MFCNHCSSGIFFFGFLYVSVEENDITRDILSFVWYFMMPEADKIMKACVDSGPNCVSVYFYTKEYRHNCNQMYKAGLFDSSNHHNVGTD